MALKQIKNKIVSTKKTGKVTKAMEAVSAVKMRKSQERAFKSRPYAHAAMSMLERVARGSENILLPYTTKRGAGKTLIVIVTSDKGLAGSVNSAVLKKALDFTTSKTCDAICIGRKAVEFAKRELKGTVLKEYTNVSDDITISDVEEIASLVTKAFTDGTYADVHVVYQNFISTFEQAPTLRQVLPLDTTELSEMVAGIRPSKGKFSETVVEEVKTSAIQYTIEPTPEEVVASLVPQLITIMLYHALLESKASEHSARMVAMKNATDKVKEMTHSLTLLFNKERQAAITAEVSEITGGIEAMKS